MADFNIRPVATDIKPVQGMSLADMVNMARGVQQYQQAGQTNPLELQRLQAEAELAPGDCFTEGQGAPRAARRMVAC